MNRNWLYFILFLVLAIVAYFTIIKKNLGSYSKKDTAFAVEDTTQVGKIVLSNLKGEKIQLEKQNNAWVMNSKYEPRPDAISNLLRTLHQLEVKVPVAKSMHNNVVKSISGKRTMVEIFDTKGEKTKGFYIGEYSDALNGNFMLMEGSDHTFVVNIPGFSGSVSTVFFTDETDWKSENIFTYNPEDIIQLDIIYTGLKDSSFSIIKTNEGKYEVTSIKKYKTPANPEIISFYLKQFKMLNAEYFINEPEKKDSILTTIPACEIMVTDKNKVTTALKIYFRPITYRTKTQYTSDDKPLQFDLDKYYGIFNNDNDLAIIQNFVFGKLLVGPDYFYRQRPAGVNTLNEAMIKK